MVKGACRFRSCSLGCDGLLFFITRINGSIRRPQAELFKGIWDKHTGIEVGSLLINFLDFHIFRNWNLTPGMPNQRNGVVSHQEESCWTKELPEIQHLFLGRGSTSVVSYASWIMEVSSEMGTLKSSILICHHEIWRTVYYTWLVVWNTFYFSIYREYSSQVTFICSEG